MEGSWLKRVFLGGTLGVAMLLSSAVLAQAQTCTTRYNALLQQYETQCTNNLSVLASMMQNLVPPMPEWNPREEERQRLANQQQQLQNEILRLRLQALQRQQALRQHNSQR